MEKQLNVEVRLETKDIFKFLIYHSLTTWQGKVTWLLGILALVGAPIMMLVVKDNFTAIIFLIVAIMYLGVTPLSHYNNAKRQMMANSVFRNKIVFNLTDELILVNQYTGEASLFWDQISRIDINRSYYFIYINDKQAFILPKRFIDKNNAKEWEDFLVQKRELALKNENNAAAKEAASTGKASGKTGGKEDNANTLSKSLKEKAKAGLQFNKSETKPKQSKGKQNKKQK